MGKEKLLADLAKLTQQDYVSVKMSSGEEFKIRRINVNPYKDSNLIQVESSDDEEFFINLDYIVSYKPL